ncbi:MAG: hypothetical protein IJ823_07765 [Bacteroidales bacterium]|nr:hypothetical protein [Bacteroidales bacterium]
MMKKITLLFAAAFAFAACQKESVKDNTPISDTKLVFNLDINYASVTKAIKTGFVNGDKIFIFFEGVTSGYATIVYDGSKFGDETLNGGLTVNDLAESGKKLRAIFLPYGNDATPTYGTSGWTFNKNTGSYFLTATDYYTLTKASGITTLTATLHMAVPSNYVQFFVPDGGATGTISLACNAVKPSGLASVSSNGTVTEINGGQGAFMTAYAATVGSDKGYYASGKLSGAGTEYYIAIEKGSKYYDYGIHTNSALANNVAIKLSAINEVGPQKYTKKTVGGKTWATVNVGATKPWMYETTQYIWQGKNNSNWTMIASGEGMPLNTDFQALVNDDNCYHRWISIAGVNGYVIIDKTTKGYMFLPASGYDGGSWWKGDNGYYWSRTEEDSEYAWSLWFDNDGLYVGNGDQKDNAFSVRPLK